MWFVSELSLNIKCWFCSHCHTSVLSLFSVCSPSSLLTLQLLSTSLLPSCSCVYVCVCVCVCVCLSWCQWASWVRAVCLVTADDEVMWPCAEFLEPLSVRLCQCLWSEHRNMDSSFLSFSLLFISLCTAGTAPHTLINTLINSLRSVHSDLYTHQYSDQYTHQYSDQ